MKNKRKNNQSLDDQIPSAKKQIQKIEQNADKYNDIPKIPKKNTQQRTGIEDQSGKDSGQKLKNNMKRDT